MPHFYIRDDMHWVRYFSGVRMLDIGVRFGSSVSPTISVVRPTAMTPDDESEAAVLGAVLAGVARSKSDPRVEHVIVKDGSWSSLSAVEYVAFLLGDAVNRGIEFADEPQPNA